MQATLALPWRGAARAEAARSQQTAGRRWLVALVPSIADLVFLGTLLVCLCAGGAMLSGDGDAARHLTVGEYMLSTGAIPHQDVFSHTMAGQPFVPYEWLSEVASAGAYRLAGPAGTVLLHGAAIAATAAILLAQLRSRGAGVLLALALALLAAATSSVHWLARPHVFTMLGAAGYYSVLDRWFRGQLSRRWLWLLPPAMLLWSNAHGGFLIGFILAGAYAGADVLRALAGDESHAPAARARLAQLLPVLAAMFLATLLNPAGPALWAHVSGYFGKRLLVDRTVEYRSPDFHLPDVRPFVAMLLVMLGALAWSRRRPQLQEGLLLAGFTYFALYSGRNIPLFAIVASPVLVSLLRAPGPAGAAAPLGHRPAAVLGAIQRWLAKRDGAYSRIDDRARGHLWPAAAVVALGIAGAAQWHAGQRPLGAGFDPHKQPVAAVEYLKANPPAGNVFNNFGWGGYLLHELWPAQQVFIDGQTDFYGEALTQEYLDAVELRAGWRDVLDRHDVRWIIFPTNSAFVRALQESGSWRTTYTDDVATVLVRAGA